jgi:hypothetical protein
VGESTRRVRSARHGGETEEERLDREVDELMQELRSVIPGAQVLFGLLLTVAFTPRFRELGVTERYVYFGTFVSALVALVLLLGPASFHRIRFRRCDKERLLRVANREMIAAFVFVAASIGGVAYLVTSVVISTTVAAVTSAVLVSAAAIVWWVVPLARRDRQRTQDVSRRPRPSGRDRAWRSARGGGAHRSVPVGPTREGTAH